MEKEIKQILNNLLSQIKKQKKELNPIVFILAASKIAAIGETKIVDEALFEVYKLRKKWKEKYE